MLPTSYFQAYHNLLNILLTLRSLLNQLPFASVAIEENWQQLEQVFQEQVIGLTAEGLDEELVSRWQLLHTEMHRSFRLLRTDILLWRTAKQETTKVQRLKVISDRLEKLINYCYLMQT